VQMQTAWTRAHVTSPTVRRRTSGLTERTTEASGRRPVLDLSTGDWLVAVSRTGRNLRAAQTSRCLWTSPAGGIRPSLGGGRKVVLMGASTPVASDSRRLTLSSPVLAGRLVAGNCGGPRELLMRWTRWGCENGQHVVSFLHSNSIQLNAIQFKPIQFNSIQFNSQRLTLRDSRAAAPRTTAARTTTRRLPGSLVLERLQRARQSTAAAAAD
jgi:hypothetical protein